jgi:hypothetical protein
MLLEILTKKVFLILLAVIIFSYSLFKIFPFFTGPHVVIDYPKNGDQISGGTFTVTGSIYNAQNASILGRPIEQSTDGRFSETVVFTLPYTIIHVEASDSWGRKSTAEVFVTAKQ